MTSSSDDADNCDKYSKQIKNIYELLAEGDHNIKLRDEHRNVLLALGNTGAGKSTFIQWLAGDSSKLISEDEGDGEFLIVDGDNRIGSSTKSQTIFPELVVDRTTNTAFYDCPGFADTRESKYDIASTYFIKKLTDYALNIKIILVIGHFAVRKGGDRHDFINLMRQTLDFIKNIEKFSNSIAIAITKVENNGTATDDKVIGAIANFLVEVKQNLEEKPNITADISEEEKRFCKRCVTLISILLKKNRIGIFRRPDEAGPLNKVGLLQKGKKHIIGMLYKELTYTEKDNDDFGYTISDRSKNHVNVLIEMINDKIWDEGHEIAEKLKKHLENLTEEVIGKIKSFIESSSIVDATQTEAQVFSTQLETGHQVLSKLCLEIKDITNVNELSEKLKNATEQLEIVNCAENIGNIFKQVEYFNFIQTVSDRKLNSRPWATLFTKIEDNLPSLNQNMKECISQVADNIFDKVNIRAANVAQIIEEHYTKKMKSLEIRILLTEFHHASDFMTNLLSDINQLKSAQELSMQIGDSIKRSEIAAFANIDIYTWPIFHYGNYLDFMKSLDSDLIDVWSPQWIVPFNKTKKFLHESEKWYQFLQDLYVKFSGYEIQENVAIYNVQNIDDWGVEGRTQGIQITTNNFLSFLEKVANHKIKKLEFVKNIEMTASRLQVLNAILTLLLRHKIEEVITESGKLTIRGRFIKFSDFTSSDGKILNRGKNELKSVEIVSLNTVFIDRDLQEIGSKVQVSIVSPKWQIIGDRTINLDGAPGHAHSPEKASNLGHNGMPGVPGGAGGNFLGVGNKFIDINHLSVFVNGGQGGPGQEGSDGREGNSGRNAEISEDFANEFLHSEKMVAVVYNTVKQKYIYYGKIGTGGGDAGSGGVGGLGGMPGHIRVLNFDNSSELPSTSCSGGCLGIGGKGGVGGRGGKRGNDRIAFFNKVFAPFPVVLSWDDNTITVSNNDRSKPGENGIEGHNGEGIQLPEQPMEFQGVASLINGYKAYARSNLGDNFQKSNLMEFVSRIDSCDFIMASYETLELVNELQDLEKQFLNLHKPVEYLPFYQSLLNRTNEYAKNPRPFEDSNSYKKVLSYLYTAIFSRKYNIETPPEPNLIIDLETYLNTVGKNISSLTNLKEKSNKVNIINKYKEDYKDNIDRKINESHIFITQHVNYEIGNIKSQVEHRVCVLVEEMTALRRKAVTEEAQLVKKRRELQRAIKTSWSLSGLKMYGQVVDCFCDLGAAAASVPSPQVAESFCLNDQGPEGSMAESPDDVLSNVASVKSKLLALKDYKLTNFKKLLVDVSAEVDKHPEKLSDTSAIVKSLAKNCEFETSYSTVVKNLEQQLKEEWIRKASELDDNESRTNVEIARAKEVIGKFKHAILIGSSGFDVVKKYVNHAEKLQTIDDAIKQKEGELLEIEENTEKIHEIITPMLRKAGEDLSNLTCQLTEKSQIMFDVKTWQVQGVFRDMKLLIRQFKKGSTTTIEADLTSCIEKLEDAMTTTINIYDRIQRYQEQNKLASYIADISSPGADRIEISNEALSKAVSELEIVIRSNMVLEQYTTAVIALTQQVFPFADRYLSLPSLPDHLLSESNFADFVKKAADQVEVMISKIADYKTAIKKSDEYLNIGAFSREYISSQPFFIWENRKYQDLIVKLLSGGKVTVKANVDKSSIEKDAIKFNRIGINFHSEDAKITSEIKQKLKGFKVSATHLGNSYYRYNSNIYVITSASQNIHFSFEEDKGEPIHKNSVFKKILSGDLMLSPYAMWEIQLFEANDGIKFQDLAVFGNKVNLELVGHGSYITRGTDTPQTHGWAKQTNDNYFLFNYTSNLEFFFRPSYFIS